MVNIYVGSFARQIFEISTDGKILNQKPTSDWVWGTPVIDNGILYVGDLGGSLYAFDTANNLQQVWVQKVAAGAIRATPLIVGDVIIVGARDQKFYWLKRADGTPVIESDGKPLVRELHGTHFIRHIAHPAGGWRGYSQTVYCCQYDFDDSVTSGLYAR